MFTFPLRCLSFLLLSTFVATFDDNLTTESLIAPAPTEKDDESVADTETMTINSTASSAVGEEMANGDGSGEEAEEVVDMTTDPATTTTTSSGDVKDSNQEDYERLGRIYVAQYYMLFDDRQKRLSLVALYQHDDSFLSYNGEKFYGTRKILGKFESLTESVVERSIIAVDSQPIHEGGLLMNVAGKYRFENDTQARLYTQTFIFRPQKGSFFLQHDILRELVESA